MVQLTVETVHLMPFQFCCYPNFHGIVRIRYTIMFKVLDYQFMPEPSIDAPTILYVPPLIYSNGYSLEVSPNLNWEVDETQQSLLLITATDSDLGHIVLRPKE